jgi:transposase-like protein
MEEILEVLKCPICLDTNYEMVVLLNCTHYLCKQCLSKLTKDNECPICKGKIESYVINRQVNNLLLKLRKDEFNQENIEVKIEIPKTEIKSSTNENDLEKTPVLIIILFFIIIATNFVGFIYSLYNNLVEISIFLGVSNLCFILATITKILKKKLSKYKICL